MTKFMEKIQQKVSATGVRTVSAPYLPSGLIWAALLLMFTDLMVILLSQPGAYWIDHSRAISDFAPIKGLLSAGIVPYVLIGLLYLLIVWAVLTVLSRSLALVIWLSLCFMHLSHILAWVFEKGSLVDESITVSSGWLLALGALTGLFLGIVLVRVLLTPKRSDVVWGRRIKTLLSFGWVGILIAAVLVSALWTKGGWVPLHPEHTPGKRGNTAVAYDSARQRIVLFGGVSDWLGSKYQHENDTWEWDGTDWIKMEPQTIPFARAGHMMAYDEKRGVVVMFGGEERSETYMLNDTWEWDGRDWKQIFPDNYPSGRRGGQMFYDHDSGRIILAGGYYYEYPDKVYTLLNDVWAWDGISWQYLTTMPRSLVINNPNVAYDTQKERSVIFDYKQVAVWEFGQWNVLEMSSGPSNRLGTWLTADTMSGRMALFGGVGDDGVQMSDTWILDANGWTELKSGLSPSPRDAYVMFFDPTRKSFILYGGMSFGALDDMWELVLQ